MDDLTGKVAVVTGGASGIGLALARRFAAEGARLVLADVEREALDAAAADLAGEHGDDRVLAVPTDVRDAAAVEALAATTFDRFGTAHVVCNNAGVAVGGVAWTVPADRWQWIVDVNLLGVANGVRAFVPRMIEQGEGHVVNTASAAGILTGPLMSPYYATKHAVVALSESLHFDLMLTGAPVGVSVLCPEFVRTRIGDSERNLPEGVTPAQPLVPVDGDGGAEAGADTGQDVVRSLVASGIDPAAVADAVVDGIRTGRFWILTHPTTLPAAQRRWTAISEGGAPELWNMAATGDG
jgi:NAD(P)-dependent dehydrogenase (short-subunit alcohol dehydrogenase family)